MDKRYGKAPSFYGVCRDCTAKWFCPHPQASCPRCASEAVSYVLLNPPWLNGKVRKQGVGEDDRKAS